MATDSYQFEPHDLEFRGGDYGAIELAGTTPAACRAIEQIVDAARRGSNKPDFHLRVVVVVPAQSHIETRHAGREGTPEAGVEASGK